VAKQVRSTIPIQKHPCYNEKKRRFEHDWDYCVTFRICTKCGKIEDLPPRVFLNYEISGEKLAWHDEKDRSWMMGEYNKNDDDEYETK